jgi:hypothetical protein
MARRRRCPKLRRLKRGTLKFGLSSTKPFKALATGFGLLTDKRIGHICA